MLVANGHHWDPKYPEPPFPGQDSFAGEQLHSHWYREPDERFEGRNVLVLGIGNSATDIAAETSRHSAMTYLAMRRGAYVLPKFIAGRPLDQLGPAWANRLPSALTRAALSRKLKQVQGPMEAYGLPTPDHKLGEAHPTVSAELLSRIGHGRVAVKPNIERIDGSTVHFTDATSARIDTIVWCTGYRITFPFLDDSLLGTAGNRVSLYRRVVHPDRRRPLLHRPGAAARRDHADRRAPGRVGRRPARGPRRAARPEAHARGDRARRRGHAAPLRRVDAAHDPGRLPPVHAPAGARAAALARRCGARCRRPASAVAASAA